MKIKKSLLEKIIREELLNHVKCLREADDKVEKGEDDVKAPEKKDAADQPPKPAQKDKAAPPDDDQEPAEPEEVPDEKEPADDELEKEREDGEGDDDRGGGKVADEVVGKRIQSITMEPKSKLVPGAMEIVITFDEIPDPLHIMITKTGQVKYHFRGALHNEL